jgi:hypothetical protein
MQGFCLISDSFDRKLFMLRITVLGVFFLCFVGLVSAQSIDKNYVGLNIPLTFQQIHTFPEHLFFDNPDFKVYSRNGHLQGIQYYSNARGKYLVLSGSSDSVAYYVMVDIKLGRVVRYNQIGNAPYDHAGGFQCIGDFLVVGTEDNAAKDASKIVFYDLSNPGQSDVVPVYTLSRGGQFKSKTAGALGITHYKAHHLMAVVSWDAATIDFYQSNGKPMHDKDFEMKLAYTWFPTKENKFGWLNQNWGSYQGISLFTGAGEKLYLFAFSLNGFRNEIDLFEVIESADTYSLKKIATRHFRAGKNSFRYGAGMQISGNGELYMYSTPYRLKKKKNMVNRYKSRMTIN